MSLHNLINCVSMGDNMDVKQVEKLKRELEVSISSEVSKLVEDFKVKAGISPSYIGIDMDCLSEMGYDIEYVVGRTRTRIEL